MADDSNQTVVTGPGGRPQIPGAPREKTPLIGAAAGAKTLQSATFGFGADAVGALTQRRNEQVIRGLAKNYEEDHPLAAFGIDLATAIGTSAAIPESAPARAGEVAAAGAKLVAKSIGIGAAAGGLSGAGSGGNLDSRIQGAKSGAVAGGIMGGLGTYVGALARPAMERVGLASTMQSASAKIKSALRADGKTMGGLISFLEKNPTARIADYSGKVSDVVGKAGGLTQDTARAVGDAAREDRSGQAGRIAGDVERAAPLSRVKQELIDNLDSMRKDMKTAYDKSKTEITEVTPGLQELLKHPEVEPLFKNAMKDFGNAKRSGLSDLAGAPKMKVTPGGVVELPSAMLDDLQKQVGVELSKAEKGTTRYGTLSDIQQKLKSHQTGSVVEAHQLAARLGGVSSETGALGAQVWGHGYAFGVKSSDIAQFRTMTPEQKEYARLGMVSGLERYLNEAGGMGEGALSKIASKLKDPAVTEVLGQKPANQVMQVFSKEAARARNTAAMASGGNRKAAFNEENESRMLAHTANVSMGFLHHTIGTAVRLLSGNGMSEKQALGIVEIAAKPGGLFKLQQAGMNKGLVDRLGKLLPHPGYALGKSAGQSDQQTSD